MKLVLSASLLAFGLTATAAADPVDLSKRGGALPGTTTLELEGTPGDLYLLIVAAYEQATALPSDATLDIPLDLLFFSSQQPGFVGLIGAGGAGSVDLFLPVHPKLVGATLSFQALSGGTLADVSNLVRLTPQAPGTFAPTLDSPDLPMAGGAVAVAPDGLLNLVGGSGPLAQSYDPDLEEFELAGASFGVGLLSQSTALADGRILFTGGLGLDGQPSAAAAIYDPSDGSTTELQMSVARAGHGATRIGDGRVLVTGGFSVLDFTDILGLFTGLQGSSEFFEPATGSFAAGPVLLEPRALHTSTPLATGGVLIAGGFELQLDPNDLLASQFTALTEADLFDGAGISATGSMQAPRTQPVLFGLEDGTVLVLGGGPLEAEVYQP